MVGPALGGFSLFRANLLLGKEFFLWKKVWKEVFSDFAAKNQYEFEVKCQALNCTNNTRFINALQ